MPSFEALFIESKGRPIEYLGRTLVMSDLFPTDGNRSIRLAFEECGGEWRQGVALKCNGTFRFAGEPLDGKSGVVFWYDTAPATVELEVDAKDGAVRVYNVWDTGDGVTHARHNGAAMIVDPLPAGRRYRCNDGFADEDFNDLVFRLERVVSR